MIEDTEKWCPFAYDNGSGGGVYNRKEPESVDEEDEYQPSRQDQLGILFTCLGNMCIAYRPGGIPPCGLIKS